MKIALIQSDLQWENTLENRKNFESKINKIDSEVNLIVLPEMFSTGFTMNAAAVAETMQGETVSWMQNLAKEKSVALTGSLIIQENNNYYNRLLFVFPNGEMQFYDKHFTSGSSKVIIEYLGWKICLQVCYDLRFPVFARNVEHYDLLLYVANWPKIRTQAWDILLRARAVENLSYVVGVNRVGFDGNNYEHIGHSQVVDFLGDYVLEPQETDDVFLVEFDKNTMLETRKKLDFLSDRDQFEIKI
jgi:omega-amidase